MSVAPAISFYKADDTTVLNDSNPNAHGAVTAGAVSADNEIHIWNDKGGGAGSATATNVQITTLTATGLSSGDTIANGNEVVTGLWVEIESITNGDSVFTSVGGSTTKTLADIASNADHVIKEHVTVPTNATAGAITYLLRLLYNYS